VAALARQAFAPFEVVACAPGLAALAPWDGRLKRVPVDEPNVLRARNLGIAAAGEVVAFIDDDAVAEHLWLARLLGAPWEGAAAAAGWVRGPDGLAWAARGLLARRNGPAEEAPADPVAPTLLRPRLSGPLPRGAWRPPAGPGYQHGLPRGRLRALGGLDEAFRFYLGQSDLFWRRGEADHAVLTVPLAQVRHGALPSERRRADRVAPSLHEVRAALAV
jgi:GT2 family glycosyltransferase